MKKEFNRKGIKKKNLNRTEKPLVLGPDRLHAIILAPLVSEKSTRVLEQGNQVVFRVLPDAEKPEIKIAVEKLFGVKVTNVSTLSVRGKSKGGASRTPGKRNNWKKAYVTLGAGQQIDFTAGVKV